MIFVLPGSKFLLHAFYWSSCFKPNKTIAFCTSIHWTKREDQFSLDNLLRKIKNRWVKLIKNKINETNKISRVIGSFKYTHGGISCGVGCRIYYHYILIMYLYVVSSLPSCLPALHKTNQNFSFICTKILLCDHSTVVHSSWYYYLLSSICIPHDLCW